MHGDAPHDEREARQDRDPDQIDRLEPEGGAANELHELVERVELGRDLKASGSWSIGKKVPATRKKA